MPVFFRRHKVVVLATTMCIIAFAAFCALRSPVRGRIAAHYDIARGRYKVFSQGLDQENRTFPRLLSERYGIQVSVIPEESATKAIFAYARGYNTVSVEAAKRRFGHDIFKECDGDARKEWDSLSFMEQVFPYAGKKAESAECFRCFAQGTAVGQIVAACGRPDDACNGRPCYKWELKDGSTVVIYQHMDRMEAVAVYRGMKLNNPDDWVLGRDAVPHK